MKSGVANTIYSAHYSIFLILLGIILYLLIKLGSDFSLSNKKTIITSEAIEKLELIDKNYFIENIFKIQQKNDDKFIISRLPIRLNELKSGLPILDSFDLEPKNNRGNQYLSALLDLEGVAKVHNNMISICDFEDYYSKFVARKMYDESINYGLFNISKKENIAKFLISNNIIFSQRLNFKSINGNKKHMKNTIINFSTFQDRVLGIRKHIFKRGNALLLSLSANSLIIEVNC